jgi:hypothetical protein
MAEEAQGQPVDRVLHLLDQPRQRRRVTGRCPLGALL